MSFWDVVLSTPRDDWQREMCQLQAEAEARRDRADYNTGSIALDEAYQLRALAEYMRADVAIDVGTFIGLSSTALASASTVKRVYTCDVSNDCLPSTDTICTYPKQSSTDMLRALVALGVRADLCFFDGVLREQDAEWLDRVTHRGTVFAVHDYNYGPKLRRAKKTGEITTQIVPRKGIGNIRLLAPRLPRHVLVKPLPTNLVAALVPKAML